MQSTKPRCSRSIAWGQILQPQLSSKAQSPSDISFSDIQQGKQNRQQQGLLQNKVWQTRLKYYVLFH